MKYVQPQGNQLLLFSLVYFGVITFMTIMKQNIKRSTENKIKSNIIPEVKNFEEN